MIFSTGIMKKDIYALIADSDIDSAEHDGGGG